MVKGFIALFLRLIKTSCCLTEILHLVRNLTVVLGKREKSLKLIAKPKLFSFYVLMQDLSLK
jgi:hypothetical protein